MVKRHQNNINDAVRVYLLLTYFTRCTGVSSVEFEQINPSWESNPPKTVNNLFFTISCRANNQFDKTMP